MKYFLSSVTIFISLLLVWLLFLRHTQERSHKLKISGAAKIRQLPAEDEEDDNEAFTQERLLFDFKMLRNPVTNRIPADAHEKEMQAARAIPVKDRGNNSTSFRVLSNEQAQNLNPYISVGPNNVAGRSRTLAFDTRNPKIMLTGGVTGGIFRSSDGGQTWTFVSPEDDIRSVTSIAQDPTSPDTWYCGTGEVYNVLSAQNIANGPYGHGIYKSTNNGVSWTKLAATADADPNSFSGFFDLVHRVAVNPANGHVYAAVHNRIMRSTDGGQTWVTVLGGTVANSSIAGLSEILIKPDGSKIYAAFSGENADRTLAGVWESATGNLSGWKRIAGGVAGQPDSVATWLAYGKWSRIVLALAPTNKLFVLYKNDKDASGSNPLPEADLFRCDMSSGNSATYVWQNMNAYVPNEPVGKIQQINPYTTQFSGFDMSIAVKPDNENLLFIGGTCLHRIDLTKTDPAQKFRRIGGYGASFFPNDFIYPNHHPDIHGIYFKGNDTLYTASDGGIHKTNTSLLADTVRWTPLTSGLQTLQYHFINIIPDVDANWIIGGAQDNGSYANTNVPSSEEQSQIGGGDGASAAMTGFYKTGNSWKQYWYFSVINGTITRSNFTWQFNPTDNSLNYISNTFTDITPKGYDTSGQYMTLFINDPDSTEHIYYNNHNKLFRTTQASAVTPTTWTEMTGIGTTVSSNEDMTAMAVSKKRNGNKYLFFGTDAGKVYRLSNPNSTSATSLPVAITPGTMTGGSYVAGISVNPRNPDTVMVVVSNYDDGGTQVNNIFWTGNATAATPVWQVLDGALEPVSSQSCAIVVKTTGVEYYVGTSVGLYSATSINGNSTSWVNEGTGMMKHAIIRSLVNRQEDNTLAVGTHGNGAFLAEIGSAVVIPPDLTTGVNDVIRNDKNFIKLVYPTVGGNDVFFKTGNLTGITHINSKVMSTNGQVLSESNLPYSDGVIHLQQLPSGPYILLFTSSNNKYQSVTRILKK